MKKKHIVFDIGIGILCLTLFSCPVDPEGDDPPKYAKEYWGEWLRMDTGDSWYISSDDIKINDYSSAGSASLSKQSDRVIEVSEDSRKYYLYASRTSNASFTGKIASFSSKARAVTGLGGIQLAVTNINNTANKSNATTDGAGNFQVDNAIPGDDYKITVEGQTTTVSPAADGDNVGTITVTDGVNFKTSIKPKSSSVRMQWLYANSTAPYTFTITIANTGTADCLAATYTLDFDDDLVVTSQPSDKIFGTIEPGKSKTIEVAVSCRPIQDEYEFKKIGIRITDPIGNKTWEDSVSLKFNKTPVNFYMQADSSIAGVIITPNAEAYTLSGTSVSFSMPWSTRDYLLVFSGATAATETRYSLGIGVPADNNFTGFTDLGNYESNNTENTATIINVSDKIMSYLHKNDIDYYKINLGSTAPSALPAPSSVSASAQSSSSISISWNSVSGATGYYIYRSTSSGGTYDYLVSTSSTSYTNTGLSSGTTYYYKVSAYNSYGESSQSSYTSATTSSSVITLSSANTWYTYDLLAGATHYYRFYASSGTHYVCWRDVDTDSGYCDIRVSARDGNGITFFSSVDNSISGTYSSRSFNVSSSGYITITVEGYSPSSSGTYKVMYY
jgi:hypothetical protein